jgi:glycosyltransferase involved in cell wall biosynthesis
VRQQLTRLLKLGRLRRAPTERRKGVLFIGYAEGNLGLGQAFRNNLRAVELASLQFAIYPLRVGIETRLIGPFMSERYDLTHVYPINVIDVAPDYAPVVLYSIDRSLTKDSYNILRTFWELPAAPPAWRSMLTGIQEIWAPNTFVANAFRNVFSGPMTVVPHAVNVEEGPYPTRDHFGMEQGRFYFIFTFDYFSSPYRKNPLGVLEAFQAAFPQGSENVGLVIKSIGRVHRYQSIRKRIRDAAALDRRIMVIEKSLSRPELLGLLNSSDAYLSLHRSEGFGSGMAEAMSLGKIVIGTNFSGNTDFLTEATGFPIPFTLRPVLRHEYPWSKGQVWAEPDLQAASLAMRLVLQSSDLVRQRAEAGRRLIRERYAPTVIGQVIKDRISRLTA